MPLLDLKTDLKSLKFGQDRPGGGSSGQPFVQYPIPEDADQEYLDHYETIRDGLGFPTRGGNLIISQDGIYASSANKFDVQRISKFLKNTTAGKVFLLKQVGMQFSNPKIQVRSEFNISAEGQLLPYLPTFETTRVYNAGINTLLQIGVQGSGIHFNRHGLLPFNTLEEKYIVVADNRLRGDYEKNRLYNIYETKIRGNDVSNKVLSDLGISKISSNILKYAGGPNSYGGIGTTTIGRYTNTINEYKIIDTAFNLTSSVVEGLYNTVLLSRDNGILYTASLGGQPISIRRYINTGTDTDSVTQVSNPRVSTINYNNTYNYRLLAQQTLDRRSTDVKEDFRRVLIRNINTRVGTQSELSSSTLQSTSGYVTANNIAIKYKLGNPGSSKITRVKYNTARTGLDADGVDGINMLDVGETGNLRKGHVSDLITFRVDSLDIDTGILKPTVFRAYLTSIQDNHAAEYGVSSFVGRAENNFNYNKVARNINFVLRVAAQSRDEMKPLYRKVNYLISQVYPDYKMYGNTLDTGFMRTPIIKLTIGDYLSYQPGFLTNVNVSIPEGASWEIVADLYGDENDMYQLPHVLELSCQFTPIHNFLARRSYSIGDKTYITPFITPNEEQNKFGIGTFK